MQSVAPGRNAGQTLGTVSSLFLSAVGCEFPEGVLPIPTLGRVPDRRRGRGLNYLASDVSRFAIGLRLSLIATDNADNLLCVRLQLGDFCR